MSIHEFPEGKALKSILDERREELAELYDTLNRAYKLAHTIEERADALENEYNHFLRRYSQAVGGIENVEVGFLEYGSEIAIDADEGIITFTPWSEEDETEM
jgi:septation ring formation regulator EzrA